MIFNNIEVYGGCDINYVLSKEEILSEDQIKALENNAIQSPEWDVATRLCAIFNDTTNGSNIDSEEITSYHIQKKSLTENIMRTVAKVDGGISSIIDFNVANRETYKYYITPLSEKNNSLITYNILDTPNISMDWSSWSIVGINQIKDNVYEVDDDNIWMFYLNIESKKRSVELSKEYQAGFNRFPKVFSYNTNYVKGSMTCYLGNIDNRSEYIDDDAQKIEKWNAFCCNQQLKLLRDTKGTVYLVDIESTSFTPEEYANGSPTKITFNFVQIDTAVDKSIFKAV